MSSPLTGTSVAGWGGRVVTAYRPDPVVDPEFEGFQANLGRLSGLTGEDCRTWAGYLAAHRKRRAFFARMGVLFGKTRNVVLPMSFERSAPAQLRLRHMPSASQLRHQVRPASRASASASMRKVSG